MVISSNRAGSVRPAAPHRAQGGLALDELGGRALDPVPEDGTMLRKIDCVMVRVGDLDAGSRFYAERLGLRELWRDESSVGMGLPETDAEVVLHTMDLPPEPAVHYLVDDARAAAASWRADGLEVRTEPFEIA